MSSTVKADTSILDYFIATYRVSFEDLKGVKTLFFNKIQATAPINYETIYFNRGGNSLGLKPSDGPLVVVLFYSSWDSPSDHNLVYAINMKACEN